jgi:phosphopantothenoylcysteine decarboxylase/phosphopantothenate--cysteine ligase
VANDVSRRDAGFGGDRNAAALIDAAGDSVQVPLMSKRELAERILDRVVELRGARGPKQVATRA